MINPAAAAARAHISLFPEFTPSAAPVDVDVDEVVVLLPFAVPEGLIVLEGIVLIVVFGKDVITPMLEDVAVTREVVTGEEVERVRDGF